MYEYEYGKAHPRESASEEMGYLLAMLCLFLAAGTDAVISERIQTSANKLRQASPRHPDAYTLRVL